MKLSRSSPASSSSWHSSWQKSQKGWNNLKEYHKTHFSHWKTTYDESSASTKALKSHQFWSTHPRTSRYELSKISLGRGGWPLTSVKSAQKSCILSSSKGSARLLCEKFLHNKHLPIPIVLTITNKASIFDKNGLKQYSPSKHRLYLRLTNGPNM